jgi:protein ImuB
VFAVIYIPDFSLQSAIRHEPDLRSRPVALVDPESAAVEITQANAAAKNFGVAEGQTPSQAAARCEHLIIKARSPARDQSATEILLQTAYAFSPNIESTAPGICTLELKGLGLESDTARQTWAQAVLGIFSQFNLDAKIGAAPTPALALLAARAANPIFAVGNSTDFVSTLPLSALEPPPDISEILSRWGIRTVGRFLALGRDGVAERLGAPALELFDRVSADAVRPLKLVAPPEDFAEQIEFEHEVETAEPLLFVLKRFVEQLSRRLETIYRVVAEFQLRLGLASGANYERAFKIPSPTGNVGVLFRMLQTHLENLRTDSPILSLRLAAVPAAPATHQFGLFERTLRDPNQFAETLARLAGLVGAENAGTPRTIATHRPDAFQMQPPDFDSPQSHLPLLSKGGEGRGEEAHANPRIEPVISVLQKHGKEARERTPHPIPLPFGSEEGEAAAELRRSGAERRPDAPPAGLTLRRFRPPLAAHFEFRKDAPALVRSEVFHGAVVRARGPFFSSGNWWDDQRWAREEWDVQAPDGRLFRVFRSGEGCFVEGVYD